ncbi:MAG: Polynucleotide 5'-hydroxyl-kinase grc3 [Piccolia ochrophora]|nr:MAG: Polynucleotide 5'-hydroxyl-kinase grc3 [Piccolia ochrophora]
MAKRKFEQSSAPTLSAVALRKQQLAANQLTTPPHNSSEELETPHFYLPNDEDIAQTFSHGDVEQVSMEGLGSSQSLHRLLDEPDATEDQAIEAARGRWDPLVDHSLLICRLTQENSSVILSSIGSTPKVQTRLCTFLPDEAILAEDDSRLCLRFKADDTLLVLGQYDLHVLKGAITFMGATLRRGDRVRVYNSTTHSLPLMQCDTTDKDAKTVAEVEMLACKSGLRLLKRTSPAFSMIWNLKSKEAGAYSVHKQRSFDPCYTITDDRIKRRLRLLQISSQWDAVLSEVASKGGRSLQVLACGPKSSGKSTFLRILTNKLLTNEQQYIMRTFEGVCILDLDPGQPEYGPPGQLSLLHVQHPSFGPPYTHPQVMPREGNRSIRAHSIAAVSPREDPLHYKACVANLLDHYRRYLDPAPLLINYPGWIVGSGLDILLQLITIAQPTDIVYMSEQGPPPIVESIQEAAGNGRIHILPSQGSNNHSHRSSTLRAMQAISYFHQTWPRDGHLRWDPMSLARTKPWIVSYGGEQPGILGIMLRDEAITPEHLITVLNGSVVAVVAIENSIALTGLHSSLGNVPDAMYLDDPPLPHSSNTNHLSPTNPYIHRSPPHLLPLLRLPSNNPLDPTHSHTLGLALIRAIDPTAQTLHLITPIAITTIRPLAKERTQIVLVHGSLDTPGWAYTEEVERLARKARKAGWGPGVGNNEKVLVGAELPWVGRRAGEDIT